MMEIRICSSTSERAVSDALSIKQLGFIAQKARIFYNPSRGLPPEHKYKRYPLTIEGTASGNTMRLRIYNVTAGSSDFSSHAMVNILRGFGFNFDESDILTLDKVNEFGWIDLDYYC